ncbi:MAG: alpha/beta hydrolase [Steroidobacteraceae bacterium]
MTSGRATLILVHGAWHGSWCWERLLPHLEQRGIAVRTVDLPSVSRSAGAEPRSASARKPGDRAVGLRDDADEVRAAIESVEGPVVLCGHSYGGMVISHAGSHPRVHSRIARLIYLCAFMPEPRQSLVAIGGDRHAPWIRMLDEQMTLPDLSLAGEVFYNDCDAPTREWAIARLAPQCNAAFIAPVARPAWRDIPSTYIVCATDGALPPDLQRTLFAPRAERSMELDTGHSPFLSQPAALAQALAQALEAGRRQGGL